ncbi:hypothetical protein ACFL0V_02220 [Nanoarchaeota archaeon]
MESIKVDILRMELAKFHPKEPYEFKIFFNDGKEKCLMYSTELNTPVLDATAVIGKIKRYEKDKNKSADTGHILDGYVNVWINEEESMTERVLNFFKKVKDEKARLLMIREPNEYMKKLNVMPSLKVEFSKR